MWGKGIRRDCDSGGHGASGDMGKDNREFVRTGRTRPNADGEDTRGRIWHLEKGESERVSSRSS